jgi:hypothetical protein
VNITRAALGPSAVRLPTACPCERQYQFSSHQSYWERCTVHVFTERSHHGHWPMLHLILRAPNYRFGRRMPACNGGAYLKSAMFHVLPMSVGSARTQVQRACLSSTWFETPQKVGDKLCTHTRRWVRAGVEKYMCPRNWHAGVGLANGEQESRAGRRHGLPPREDGKFLSDHVVVWRSCSSHIHDRPPSCGCHHGRFRIRPAEQTLPVYTTTQ